MLVHSYVENYPELVQGTGDSMPNAATPLMLTPPGYGPASAHSPQLDWKRKRGNRAEEESMNASLSSPAPFFSDPRNESRQNSGGNWVHGVGTPLPFTYMSQGRGHKWWINLLRAFACKMIIHVLKPFHQYVFIKISLTSVVVFWRSWPNQKLHIILFLMIFWTQNVDNPSTFIFLKEHAIQVLAT